MGNAMVSPTRDSVGARSTLRGSYGRELLCEDGLTGGRVRGNPPAWEADAARDFSREATLIRIIGIYGDYKEKKE